MNRRRPQPQPRLLPPPSVAAPQAQRAVSAANEEAAGGLVPPLPAKIDFTSLSSKAMFDSLAGFDARGIALEEPRAARYKKAELDAIAEAAYHYLRCGGAKLAEAIFEGLAAIDPRDPYYLLGLGLSADHAGHKDLAKSAYQRAAKLDPADGRAEINLAELMLESGDRASAVKLLESAARKTKLRGDFELTDKATAFLALIRQTPASRRSVEVMR